MDEDALNKLEERLESLERTLAWVSNTQVRLLRLFAAQWMFAVLISLGKSPTPEMLERLGNVIGLHPLTLEEVSQELRRLLEASEAPPLPSDRPKS
ncbi:hypothetical protein KZX47_11700 [Thermus sp. SYSU G05001]|uniref:Uncharacterized protein n=1 Tax=Thermus brevis TaxID=2862456 RepID=A0ABS7A0L0_9DEIN|nr:hypothetical protein [Thermus brevis]MBW6395808.1 hypothetical protein [Thermus brevis]